jgi:hypothetical protein
VRRLSSSEDFRYATILAICKEKSTKGFSQNDRAGAYRADRHLMSAKK